MYELLGGAARDGVMVYCHASGSTLDELSADFQRHLDLGYLAIRAQAAIPGLKTYGIAPTDGNIYEPASGNVPQEDIWENSYYLDFAPEVMARLRSEFGYQVHLLHDVHHRLSPIEAGRLHRWSRTGCSGSRIRLRPRTSPRSDSSGSTPRRRLRSARCSTASGTVNS